MDIDALAVMVKAVAYAALLQAVGIALFLALFGARLEVSTAAVRRLGIVLSGVGLLTVLASYGLEAGRMSGEFAGVMDNAMHRRLAHLPLAAATSLRVLGSALLITAFVWTAREAKVLGVIGAALVTESFLLVGHSVSHEPRWAIVSLLQLHLLVAAFWIGSIAPLILVARREPAAVVHQVVMRFSALATVLVPAMAVAGLVMAWLLTSGRYSIRDPYTAALTGKVALLVVALSLAALNRARLGPALLEGAASAVRRFSLSLAVELIVLLGIVVVTAAMTSLFSPPMASMSGARVAGIRAIVSLPVSPRPVMVLGRTHSTVSAWTS